MSKKNLLHRAIALRKQGKSYTDIKKILGVSKSTLSLWLRNVTLTDKQVKLLNKRKLDGARLIAGSILRKRRIETSLQTIKEAWSDVPYLLQKPIFMLGTSLYWAEGGKTTESISFSNSDPLMIKMIIKWLLLFCNVRKKKIRAQLHIHSLHCRPKTEKYWSRITGIPLSQFTKTYVKQTSLGQRKNKLYNGTLVIRVHDTTLFRKFIGWKFGILECLDIIHFSLNNKEKFIRNMVIKRKYKT